MISKRSLKLFKIRIDLGFATAQYCQKPTLQIEIHRTGLPRYHKLDTKQHIKPDGRFDFARNNYV